MHDPALKSYNGPAHDAIVAEAKTFGSSIKVVAQPPAYQYYQRPNYPQMVQMQPMQYPRMPYPVSGQGIMMKEQQSYFVPQGIPQSQLPNSFGFPVTFSASMSNNYDKPKNDEEQE